MASLKTAYIVKLMGFVLLFTLAQVLVVAGIEFALYGLPSVTDLMTIRTPNFTQTILWKDRIWYPVLKVVPGRSLRMADLAYIDPEKQGTLGDSTLKVPFPVSGLVAQGNVLWAVSPHSVVKIDGEEQTEFPTKRVLTRMTAPFLYDDQLSVIDVGVNGTSRLLRFAGNEWQDVETLVLPSDFGSTLVDGKTVLAPLPKGPALKTSLTDLQVVASNGKIHTIITDGEIIAYREGFAFAPVSALAPANMATTPDLSNLHEWQVICQMPKRPGGLVQNRWKLCVVDEIPCVLVVNSSPTNPLQGGRLDVYRPGSAGWTLAFSETMPAMLELLVASDSQRTYVASQSLVQILRFQQLTATSLRPTGVSFKASNVRLEEFMQHVIRIYQWVYWIGIFLMALGMSRLMKAERPARYEFGATTAELASLTRRAGARLVDYFVYAIPVFVLSLLMGMGSQKQVEQNMERLFDLGMQGFALRFIVLFMAWLILAVVILMLNSWLQGRWGVTLGKWLFGIRTAQTTLRPCGFARAMVRELLLPVETLLGNVSLIPLLTMALTSNRQRAGDIVADTIVIRGPLPAVGPRYEKKLDTLSTPEIV